MNLSEKIVKSKAVRRNGEVLTVEEMSFSPDGLVKNAEVVMSDGKPYGLVLTMKNRIFKYEPEVEALVCEALEKEQQAQNQKIAEIAASVAHPAETKATARAAQKENTAVPFVMPRDCIDNFHQDGYEFLSNFYDCSVTYNGLTYKNSEAAFQAQKDLSRSEEFTTLTPNQAKQRGKRVQLRPDWEAVKVDLMKEIVRAKFNQHEDLKEKLLATGDKCLVEGNTWNDRFWGVCRGNGKNHLGTILMEIREELRAQNP